jgi:uncharacterized membrane protein (UPF0127 family)
MSQPSPGAKQVSGGTQRRGGWLLLGGLLVGGGWLGAVQAKGGETGPPQWLPIEARWCLTQGEPGRCIDLEVPRTPRQFSMGLQMRPALPPMRGMWFAFTPPSPVSFWMHRTLAPLDLIFIADNRILRIDANVPICPRLPCPTYGPEEPVESVVELGAGEAQRLGLKPGSPVEIRRLPRPAMPSPQKRD